VNAVGEIYVCSETVLYKVSLPDDGGTTVDLVQASIMTTSNDARFYGLAFAPAGALGPEEALVAGDGSGYLWSVNAATGATVELGTFGPDPTNSANYLGLSGDMTFYRDSTSGQYKGLATLRSCTPPTNPDYSPTCVKDNDYLAAIDMTALATAVSTGTPAPSLNGGIYGGSATTNGTGIGGGEMFGLAAVSAEIAAFSDFQLFSDGGDNPAKIWSVATPSGAGTVIPVGPPSFTDGWSGAGVTSAITFTLPAPPPPPPVSDD
jgi:hypothetical protein